MPIWGLYFSTMHLLCNSYIWHISFSTTLCLIFEIRKTLLFGVCLFKRNSFVFVIFLTTLLCVIVWICLCVIYEIKIQNFPVVLSPRGTFSVFAIFLRRAFLWTFRTALFLILEIERTDNFPEFVYPREIFVCLQLFRTTRRLEERGWNGRILAIWITFSCCFI
jgi:hypothetical protein